MKKLIAIFALVFSVCVLNLKAQPGAQYIDVDGVILEITFYEGNECAYVDVNGDMVWDRRVNIRAIADEYKLGGCHCFKVGETISMGLRRGLDAKRVRMYRNSGENPANYGYGTGYYGTGYYGGGYYGPGYYGGNSAGISMTIGGATVGGSITSYGGQRRISGGVNVNSGNVHVNAGGSTVVRRSQPQQVYSQSQPQQVYQNQQVYSQQNQQQNNNSTRVVEVPVDQLSSYLGL